MDKVKCKGHTRAGAPCKNNPITGATVCRMHGGSAPQVKKAARQRILEAAEDAASVLVRLMTDVTAPHNVRLAAARDLLDRAGEGAKQQVEVTTVDYTDAEIRSLARQLAAKAASTAGAVPQ